MDVEWCECSQWRKNGIMEVGEGKVVGDVRGCGWCYGDRFNWMIMMTINMKKIIIIIIINSYLP